MKLVHCQIENFGKLANFDYDFMDGLNCIQRENGWGKSTLATFIKAMFYGLPASTKKSVTENERKHYQPWQGGNYGGSLVFEANGKQYRIERFFGKKQAEDTCRVIDVATGKATKDFTENVGVELFNLDADAFERSCYIPQKVLDHNLNESITARLNNLMQGAEQEYNFDNTYSRLDKKRSGLSNKQKTGRIQNLQKQITECDYQIHALESQAQNIVTYETQAATLAAKVTELENQQNQVKRQMQTYSHLEQKRAHQEMYAELNRKVSATQEQIEARQTVLNQQNTSVTEIDQYLSLAQNVAAKRQALQMQMGQNQTTGAPERRHKWLGWGLLGAGALVMLVGLLVWSVQMVVAIVLLLCGVGAIFGAVYCSLLNRINSQLQRPANNQLSNELSAEQAQVNEFLARFQFDRENLSELERLQTLKQTVVELANLQTQLTADVNALERFKIEKHFDVNEAAVEVDFARLQHELDTLQAQIDAVNLEKAELKVKIEQTRAELSALVTMREEKARLQAEQSALQQELNAVQSAMNFLEKAHQSLVTNFLDPMKTGLKKYLALITKQPFDNLSLDTDFNLEFSEHGQLRPVESYSLGYQNAFNLGLRFALIDALYRQEKPFIVLDDPFVNLDEAKIAQAKQLLQDLAQDYQLIYFACHGSRC